MFQHSTVISHLCSDKYNMSLFSKSKYHTSKHNYKQIGCTNPVSEGLHLALCTRKQVEILVSIDD